MHRGEVWLINLDPTVGTEIRKTRPAVIVNDDAVGVLSLKVIVPITDWKEHYIKRMAYIKFRQQMPFRYVRYHKRDLFDDWEN